MPHSRTTWLVDGNGIAYGLRTDLPKWIVELLPLFEDECLNYIKACGDRAWKDIEANNRGRHWYMVVGADRQISEVSTPLLHCFRTNLRLLARQAHTVSSGSHGGDYEAARTTHSDVKNHVSGISVVNVSWAETV